jgi:nucleotidyltransferase/DNA polymerase involved in DNA repair
VQVASQLHSLLRGFAPDGQVEKTSYDDFYMDITAACCNSISSSIVYSSSGNGSSTRRVTAGGHLQAAVGAAADAGADHCEGLQDASRVFVVSMPTGATPDQQQQQQSAATLIHTQQQQQQIAALPCNWHLLEPELQRGVKFALQLRAAVKASIGLTVSCGVAPGKLLARLVTPLNKPDAVTGGRSGWL